MATGNPFDILGDDDNDDPSQLIAAQQQKVVAKKPVAAPAPVGGAAARLPSKPLPPSQAVREAREVKSIPGPARGGGAASRGGGPGRGRSGRGGGLGPNREFGTRNFGNENPDRFSGVAAAAGGAGGGEDGDAGKLQEGERYQRRPYSGGRRGGYGGRGSGYGNGEAGDDSERLPRRSYERRSGTGRGYEMKRDGAGRGNWGTAAEEAAGAQDKEEISNAEDKAVVTEKSPEQEQVPSPESNKENKEGATNETEEKEEDKEMTLEEYEKIMEEKRKNLLALKTEERKVEIDKELQSMQPLATKKANDDVFVKLGADKDSGKKKDNNDRDEKTKKSLRITEFLKPVEGERSYNPGGRGRGRGRGERGPFRGGYGGGSSFSAAAPSIEDPGQFPTLGAK